MFWAKRFLLLALLVLGTFAQALPQGVVEVYSAYTDIKTQKVEIIKGYGVIVKLVIKQDPTSDAVVWAIQTASHLSQGGLDKTRIPRLGVRIETNDGQELFAHYNEYEFPKELLPAVGKAKITPIIFSSYFANMRDNEFLIISPPTETNRYSEFVEITAIGGKVISYKLAHDPATFMGKPVNGWRLKRIRDSLGILCPITFPSCLKDEPEVHTSGTEGIYSKRVAELGWDQSEYDYLFFTSTDQGMSGLPVLNYWKEASNKELIHRAESGYLAAVMSVVSSSSRLSKETWGVNMDPVDTFWKWYEAKFKNNQNSKIIGEQLGFWELENGILRRTLRGEKHTYIEWSPDDSSEVSNTSFRCANGNEFRTDNGNGFRMDNGNGFRMDNGNGFRMDNGNGFRMDNGEGCLRTTALGKGGFKVAGPDGTFQKSNLLVAAHPLYTRIVPPTVAGMALSHYVKDADARRLEKGIYAGLRFTEYLEQNPQVAWIDFKNLFSSLYQAANLSDQDRAWILARNQPSEGIEWKKFVSDLEVTRLKRESHIEDVYGSEGHLTLFAAVNSQQQFVGVWIELEFDNQQIVRWVSFTRTNGFANSPFEPYVTLPKFGHLELAGLLTHNPDRMNIADLRKGSPVLFNPDPEKLPAELKDRNIKYLIALDKIDGDPRIGTVFTLQGAEKTYYFSTLRKD